MNCRRLSFAMILTRHCNRGWETQDSFPSEREHITYNTHNIYIIHWNEKVSNVAKFSSLHVFPHKGKIHVQRNEKVINLTKCSSFQTVSPSERENICTPKRKSSIQVDEIFVIGCSGISRNDDVQCRQWRIFHHNDISVSVILACDAKRQYSSTQQFLTYLSNTLWTLNHLWTQSYTGVLKSWSKSSKCTNGVLKNWFYTCFWKTAWESHTNGIPRMTNCFPQNRHPIARPWGQAMGFLLWGENRIHSATVVTVPYVISW